MGDVPCMPLGAFSFPFYTVFKARASALGCGLVSERTYYEK